ncbi:MULTISPECIES: hypothetical protein [Pseudomonas]|uniref:hypothetical protein n=1 Tax=Pseudomonas TaxID=286 RepID=UPI0030039784
MQYNGLALATGLLALIITLIALRILFGGHWFLAWLRGMCGLVFAGFAAVLGLVAYDLLSYATIPAEQPLATLSFKAQEDAYEVTIVEHDRQRTVTLEGDLWQLDARLFKWKSLAELIGMEPGYRLEKLSGRFLAIEQQQRARHQQVALAHSLYGIDLWRWLRLGQHDLLVFDAQAVRVDFLPIADGAQYSVALTPTGLLAQPVNPTAERALRNWQ